MKASIIYRGFEVRPNANPTSAPVAAIIGGRALPAADVSAALDLIDQHAALMFYREVPITRSGVDYVFRVMGETFNIDTIDGTIETIDEVLDGRLLPEPDVEPANSG